MSSVIGKELFLNAPIGIASVSREGLITQVNPKLCEMLCYDHDELLGKSILDIMHPNDGVHGKQSLIHFKGLTDFNLERLCLRKDNSSFWVSINASVSYSNEDVVLYITSIYQDESVNRSYIEQLESERIKFRSILETTLDGFWTVDLTGQILECNDAYSRLIGYSREELLSMHITDLEADESADATKSRINTIVTSGNAEFMTHHRHKMGHIIPIQVSATYQSDSNQTICAFLRDCTAIEETYKALNISAKLVLEARQTVVSISEHTLREIGQELHDDLGQILTGAAMLAEALSGGATVCGAKCEASKEISLLLNEAVKKTRSIAQGLYPVGLQNNGLLAMVNSLVERINSNFKIQLALTVNARDLYFNEAESLHIYRILQEGINNIIRHSQATQASIVFNKNKDSYTIELSDNGIGLPTKESKIENNSGLGLQSIQYRAEKMGADIVFKNKPSGGLLLRLTFPLNKHLQETPYALHV